MNLELLKICRIHLSLIVANFGTLDTNPFIFQHFDLCTMDVTCDGHSVYGKSFEPRFGNDQYIKSFLSVYQALASQNQIQNCNIDYEGYTGGYCFLGYDLTLDQSVSFALYTNLEPQVGVQFATTLAKTINFLVYAEFDNLIEINGLREVSTDC